VFIFYHTPFIFKETLGCPIRAWILLTHAASNVPAIAETWGRLFRRGSSVSRHLPDYFIFTGNTPGRLVHKLISDTATLNRVLLFFMLQWLTIHNFSDSWLQSGFASALAGLCCHKRCGCLGSQLEGNSKNKHSSKTSIFSWPCFVASNSRPSFLSVSLKSARLANGSGKWPKRKSVLQLYVVLLS